MRAEGRLVTDESLLGVVEALRREMVGAGPLTRLLREPGVTDVLVNGPTQVWVDRGRGLEPAEVRFADDGEVRRLAQRLAAATGRRLDDSSPFVDTRLPDGTRVHAALATQAVPGTCLSFRVPARRAFSLEDCIATGAVSPSLAAVLPGWSRAGPRSWSPAAPDRARRPCSRRCSRWCRPASGWWWWRTPASCAPTTRTWSAWRGARPTPRAAVRSP